MNKPDPGTPIFGELNNELGGLPDIDEHEFESHSFDFGGSGETPSEQNSDASSPASGSAAQSGSGKQAKGAARSGGRRRKED